MDIMQVDCFNRRLSGADYLKDIPKKLTSSDISRQIMEFLREGGQIVSVEMGKTSATYQIDEKGQYRRKGLNIRGKNHGKVS